MEVLPFASSTRSTASGRRCGIGSTTRTHLDNTRTSSPRVVGKTLEVTSLVCGTAMLKEGFSGGECGDDDLLECQKTSQSAPGENWY